MSLSGGPWWAPRGFALNTGVYNSLLISGDTGSEPGLGKRERQ